METKKAYVRPELEELGAVHDVTGGLFDGLNLLFGGGRPSWPGFPGFPGGSGKGSR